MPSGKALRLPRAHLNFGAQDQPLAGTQQEPDHGSGCGALYDPAVEVPVQFFQSTIAIELAVTGALLFQIRYFEPRGAANSGKAELPDPRLRLLVGIILGATIFGSLYGIVRPGGPEVAMGVTVGVALSVLPILTHVLPPLVDEAHPSGRRSISSVTTIGLLLYVVAVAGLVAVLGR